MSVSINFKILEREAIDKLAGEDMQAAAEVLPELAYCFSISGFSLEDWMEYRETLIMKAELKSKSPELLRMKLEIAEREQRRSRQLAPRRGISH